jgi:hypothetical protein
MESDGYVCCGANCDQRVEAPQQVCDTCWGHRPFLRDALPALWVRAHTLLPPGAAPIDATRMGQRSGGSSAPLRMSVYAAIEMTLLGVTGWAAVIRQRDGHEPLPGLATVRASFMFVRAHESLVLWDHTLAGSLLGTSYYDGLYQMHRGLLQVCGEARDARAKVACPNDFCGMLTVISRSGGDWFACLSCGSRWSQARFLAILDEGKPVSVGASLSYEAVDTAYAEPGNVPVVEPLGLPGPEPAVELLARVRRELIAANTASGKPQRRKRGRR